MIDHRRVRRGFTLVELLVVIGIIALLVGILLPVISKVRISGYIADTKNWMNQIQGSIERYYSDFHAYPGPIPNNNIADAGFTSTNYKDPVTSFFTPATVASSTLNTGYDVSAFATTKITGSENLVLGLLGGLSVGTNTIVYDPTQVGLGPMNLNTANPKRFPKYLDATNLSWNTPTATGLKTGHYVDDAGAANDSAIPEFVDRFPDTMPILYLRCKKGVDPIPPNATGYGITYNSVITYTQGFDSTAPGANRAGPYDLSQIIGYTGATPPIGVGRTTKASDYAVTVFPAQGLGTITTAASLDKADSKYQFPYDAFPYFENPANRRPDNATKGNTDIELPRQKDSYILIAPGKDRTYGTDDDICNFGDVKP